MQEQKNRSNTRMPVNSYLETNRVQEARRDRQTATGLMALLSVLVPPAGLLAVWRSKRITAPVRIALSMVALVSMTFILWVWLRSGQTSTGILPTPIVPRYAGYNAAAAVATPEPVVVYDTLPVETESVFTVTYGDGTVENLNEGTTMPVDPASYVTIVYAVTNNATKYHSQQVCDYVTNARVPTLDDAIAEGLQPCEKCVLGAGTAAG